MSTPAVDEPVPAGQDEALPPAPAWRRIGVMLTVAVVLVIVSAVIDHVRGEGRPAAPPGSWTLVPHTGLGAWVDAYDWSHALGGPHPAVGVEEIDAMADAGVQTLYLQTAHQRSAADVLEPDRLDDLIDRAHHDHLHVVAWYLPTFLDPAQDLRRLEAAAALDVDGLAVDLESTAVADPGDRTQRMLDLSRRLRDHVGPERTLAAITLSAVHVQVVNPAYWPGYPYAELAGDYAVLMPMAYWTIRTGDLRAGATYVRQNLERIRAAVGPTEPIHVIGGIADAATDADLDGMVQATRDDGAVGGSLYDWATSTPEQWERLRPLRALRQPAA
jgi:hypothetical protein